MGTVPYEFFLPVLVLRSLCIYTINAHCETLCVFLHCTDYVVPRYWKKTFIKYRSRDLFN